ncbi:hypothetical protein [Moraxella lacunata]
MPNLSAICSCVQLFCSRSSRMVSVSIIKIPIFFKKRPLAVSK